jgi:hypothetical protein
MKPIGFVYLTTNIVNGKIYVGQFTFKEDKRLNAIYLGSGTVIEQAIKKYGRKNFKRKILKLCYSINQLNGYETYYTLKYNPNLDPNIGYNQIIGPVRRSGNKNPMSYPNVRNKSIKSNRKTTSNEEYKKKQSEIMKEYFKTHEANFKGCKHSEETKDKIRQKSIGRKAWNKGKHVSEEQKRKQSKKMKGRYVGENNPNYGNKWDEELRKHLSNIKKIQYIGRKWITNGECEKFVNINNGLTQGYYLGRLKKVQIKKR